jgi:hypothetical protein
MVITTTEKLESFIDLGSTGQRESEDLVEGEVFNLILGPNQSVEVEDQWYPLINIQSAWNAGYIEITNYQVDATFPSLADSPASYGGKAGDSILVNESEDGLVFSKVQKQEVTRLTDHATLTTAQYMIFADTDGQAINLNLPAGADGVNYRIANTGSSGNLVNIFPNGVELLLGENSDFSLLDGDVLEMIYESTEGWI